MSYSPLPCDFADCQRPRLTRGLCTGHYAQLMRGADLTPITKGGGRPASGPCEFDGCERRGNNFGWCRPHWQQKSAGKEPVALRPYTVRTSPNCLGADCKRMSRHRDYCSGHYQQFMRTGETRPIKRTYRYDGPNGYIILHRPGHPNASKAGRVLEHVFVMAEHLGRPLRQGENVHHLNGQRDDNRPENLELWSTSQPKGQRVADKVAWARELLALYDVEMTEHPRELGLT